MENLERIKQTLICFILCIPVLFSQDEKYNKLDMGCKYEQVMPKQLRIHTQKKNAENNVRKTHREIQTWGMIDLLSWYEKHESL